MNCFVVYVPHQMQFICLLSSVKTAKEGDSVLGTWSLIIIITSDQILHKLHWPYPIESMCGY